MQLAKKAMQLAKKAMQLAKKATQLAIAKKATQLANTATQLAKKATRPATGTHPDANKTDNAGFQCAQVQKRDTMEVRACWVESGNAHSWGVNRRELDTPRIRLKRAICLIFSRGIGGYK